MRKVISASRRTDIPAFYSKWLVNRLKAGYVFVQHPFTRRMLHVSLKPEDISAIVFWSKNYSPLLDKLQTIERISPNLFFHFTITSAQELELNTPHFKDAIRDYIFLAKRYSPSRIIWRFDPICITENTPFSIHEERFLQYIDLFNGHASMCIISFVQPYKKVLNNLRKYADQTLCEQTFEDKRKYALQLAMHAEKKNIQLFACCNDYLLSRKILKARCIDGNYLTRVFRSPLESHSAPSRKHCACTKSIDIGAYNTCAHGCLYCYATMDKNIALGVVGAHNPYWNALHKHVDETTICAPSN